MVIKASLYQMIYNAVVKALATVLSDNLKTSEIHDSVNEEEETLKDSVNVNHINNSLIHNIQPQSSSLYQEIYKQNSTLDNKLKETVYRKVIVSESDKGSNISGLVNEIEPVIQTNSANKSSGQNSFTGEFYQTHSRRKCNPNTL